MTIKTLTAAAAFMICCLHSSALTGSWTGELNLGASRLKLVFNFKEDSLGSTFCTLDSPMQGAKGIPTEVTLCSADSLEVRCAKIGASFTGRIAPGIIDGTFRQGPYSFALQLTPEESLEVRRPQTPQPPFPYSVTDTIFIAPDGASLSATLAMPADVKSRVPVVVMVTGSGAQNRDEELLDHKPFAVIADFLARNGIGSLRYDDRGFGHSEGDFNNATTQIFKEDAASAVTFLRSLPNVSKVGVLGHSEGGTIAFILGAEKKADFAVSLAGMALSGKETLMRQNALALDKLNLPEAEKEDALTLIDRIFDEIIVQNKHNAPSPINVDSLQQAMGLSINPALLASMRATQKMRSKWFDGFVALTPSEYLSKTKIPLLAINGDKDTQVDGPANLELIRKCNPKATTVLMPGLNHLFQHCKTGDLSEYDSIRETISPEVLQLIADFIKRQ